MKIFVILLIVLLTKCQQITLGMQYLSDKFYGKIDTNPYYHYQVVQETDNHCLSSNYQCTFINHQKLSLYVDHTKDHLKPKIMKTMHEFIDYLSTHQRPYFKENQRKELDSYYEKYYLL